MSGFYLHHFFRGLSVRGLLLGSFLIVTKLHASDDALIFSDQRNNGWGDWGWVPHYSTNNPVHSGSNVTVFAATGSYQAWWLKHNPIDMAISTAITFWLNGGTTGGLLQYAHEQ